MLKEQYAHLRAQIPLMYALMFVDTTFLGIGAYREHIGVYGVLPPALLCGLIAFRAMIWVARRGREISVEQIRRQLYGTVAGAAILSAGFGGWGLLLLDHAGPEHGTALALYIFGGAISCSYSLQALPLAGWCTLLFGAVPVTLRLLGSDDWYLMGIGVTFLLVAGVLVRTLGNSFASFKELLLSRSEMGALIAALQSSEEHYRYSVDLNPQIPWIADPTGALTELSPRWEALTGVPIARSLGHAWANCLHPDDVAPVQAIWHRALTLGDGHLADVRYRLRHRDGGYRWYRARAFPRRDAAGRILSWYGNLEDIEDHVVAESALQASEERYRLASLASNDIIIDIALEEGRLDWGGAAATFFGHDLIAKGASTAWWLERMHPEDRITIMALYESMAESGAEHWTAEFRFLGGDGDYLDLFARYRLVRNAEGRPVRLIATLQDVTARKRYEDELRWAAHYDSLTGLPNRVLFAERLEGALGDARARGRHVGLIVLDVDRFKTVNDSLGHDAGDALLREIAARLTRQAPRSATVARLGGDEFAIILPDLHHAGERAVADRLIGEVAGAMFYEGRQIEVSLSAGSAIAFSDGDSSEELHKSADLALYAAKSEGIGRTAHFRHDLRDAAARRARMLSDARAALDADRVVPFYQPKVCLRTGQCVGFEALLRWHDHQGLQRPAAIGAAFDDPRLSVRLTDRMLDRVIEDMRFWRARGVAFHSIAINGSAGDFMLGDFAERILERLHRANLPPSAIELEVTESVFLGQLAENVSVALTTLAAQGVTIALDDFGTGYASLTHLKQFPVDSLKIDRSFVSMLGMVETEDAAIVGAVIDLAGNLGIRTVAEGIQTPEQLAHLIVKGCDVGQGYLFGRPMAAAQVAEAIAGWDDQAVRALCGSADWGQTLRKVHRNRFP